jgi:hypothetical protein
VRVRVCTEGLIDTKPIASAIYRTYLGLGGCGVVSTLGRVSRAKRDVSDEGSAPGARVTILCVAPFCICKLAENVEPRKGTPLGPDRPPPLEAAPRHQAASSTFGGAGSACPAEDRGGNRHAWSGTTPAVFAGATAQRSGCRRLVSNWRPLSAHQSWEQVDLAALWNWREEGATVNGAVDRDGDAAVENRASAADKVRPALRAGHGWSRPRPRTPSCHQPVT